MAWQQFLFVLPNPWTGIDTDGRTYADPAGHVIHDPAIVPIAERSLVGCSIAGVEILQAARLQTVKGVTVTSSPAIQRTRFQYDREPTRVMNTSWYREEIKKGHLIAATLDTYLACGMKPDEFVEPAKLLADLRAAAIVEMLASNPDMPEPSEPLYVGEAPVEAVKPPEGSGNPPVSGGNPPVSTEAASTLTDSALAPAPAPEPVTEANSAEDASDSSSSTRSSRRR
ncbi:MAG TPA: hypothetical protein VG734_25950 [Lacunisphaera sp.]|nr:hypothetical protein [Lacunisphaera sp.]